MDKNMNDDIKIEDDLYKEKKKEEEPNRVIEETEIISKKLDNELVEKVRRIVIKGQIDGK